MFEFLKKVELFAGLPKEDLLQICREAEERRLVAGEVLCKEGEPGDEAYVIQEGRLEVVKESDGREVLLAVRESGEVIGEMALLEEAPRVATIRAATECLLVVVDKETLDHLLATSISAANAMFRTILARWRGMEGMLRQSEKMAQLGTMSAGIAHELNNPAAAVTRSAGQLQAAIGVLGEADARLRKVSFAEEQDRAIADLAATLVDRKRPAELDALARSDREFELEDWLDDRGGWRTPGSWRQHLSTSATRPPISMHWSAISLRGSFLQSSAGSAPRFPRTIWCQRSARAPSGSLT